LCRNNTVALLTAAGYGFSITMIDITCDVRDMRLRYFWFSWPFITFWIFYSVGANRSRLSAQSPYSAFSQV